MPVVTETKEERRKRLKRERQVRYYYAHRDECLARSAAWRAENPEKDRARHRRWYHNNKQKADAKTRRYREQHREGINARRRARDRERQGKVRAQMAQEDTLAAQQQRDDVLREHHDRARQLVAEDPLYKFARALCQG